MVKAYRKGYFGEWKLVHKLSEMGFMVVRTPRSGRIGLASPDIIAAKDGRLIVFECKSRKAAFVIEENQLLGLKEWEEKAGADVYIAWKMSRKPWIFLKLSDVMENKGNVGKKLASMFGVSIENI